MVSIVGAPVCTIGRWCVQLRVFAALRRLMGAFECGHCLRQLLGSMQPFAGCVQLGGLAPVCFHHLLR